MGTTLVAAVVEDGQLYWVATGDSRLYLYRGADGSLTQCTQDHNHRGDLLRQVAEGTLSRDLAESDPDRDALTSFVGMAEIPRVDRNLRPLTLFPEDRLLLCSDGIHGVLTQTEIAETLGQNAQDCADLLIAAVKAKALERQDNATAVLIECRTELVPTRTARPPHRRSKHRVLVILLGLLLGLLAALGSGIWIGRNLGLWFPTQ